MLSRDGNKARDSRITMQNQALIVIQFKLAALLGTRSSTKQG